MSDTHDQPPSGLVEGLAETLWAWSWTVDQGKRHAPFPYDRLIAATKDDLRLAARRVLATNDGRERALAEIAAIQADCDQARWMRDTARRALVPEAQPPHQDESEAIRVLRWLVELKQMKESDLARYEANAEGKGAAWEAAKRVLREQGRPAHPEAQP